MSDFNKALRNTLRIALQEVSKDTALECDREDVLVTCARLLRGEEGETAARSLHHMREQRREQLTLRGLLKQDGEQT